MQHGSDEFRAAQGPTVVQYSQTLWMKALCCGASCKDHLVIASIVDMRRY